MSDFHDVVNLSIEVHNAAGVLENAGSVVCTITLPDGTTAQPSVSNDSAGVYSIAYVPTVVGHHSVEWEATGANACGFTDVFNISAESPTALISLAEAKQAVNFTTTDHDEELRLYIEAATDMIERVVGPVIPRTVTELVNVRGGRAALTQTPVVSVTSLASATGTGISYVTADVLVSPQSGLVCYADGTGLTSGAYSATYVAGRSGAIAPRFLHACRLLVQHMWATQRGSSSPGRNRSTAEAPVGTGYTMPNRVLELLQLDTIGPLVG